MNVVFIKEKCLIYKVYPTYAYSHLKCRCKVCIEGRKKYIRAWKDKNPDKVKRYNKNTIAWRKKNPDIYKATKKRQHMKSLYGISLEKYTELVDKQKGVCAICGGVNKNGMKLSVDHNHISRKIRGLLCNNCNRFLGLAKDSKKVLRKAIKYLEKKGE